MSDGFERYGPDLKPVAEFKTADIDAFMQGAIDCFARQEQLGPRSTAIDLRS